MDNSPMYDDVTWDPAQNKMLIYDIGMTGEYIGECEVRKQFLCVCVLIVLSFLSFLFINFIFNSFYFFSHSGDGHHSVPSRGCILFIQWFADVHNSDDVITTR